MDTTLRGRALDMPEPNWHLPQPAARDRGWGAALELRFERRGAGTVLAHGRHIGPLRVQKMLHPEGADPCHAIVLHPPAGIAGGDQLSLDVSLAPAAKVLVTTPGASKWYRSASAQAGSVTRLAVGEQAVLEYLPREAIAFDGARAQVDLEMDVGAGARMIGFDLWCLGRTASGERFESGRLRLVTRLRRSGRLCWEERGTFAGGSAPLRALAGCAGEPVFGTLWAVGAEAPRQLVDACRSLRLAAAGRGALTQLPDVLIARYLGPSTEEAFAWFTALWTLLRPAYAGRDAVPPRIWSV